MKLALSALLMLASARAMAAPAVHPIDPPDSAFLKTAIGDARMVALGESIHVTNEMPRARLALLRPLHEQMGFNVIAFEGSLVDAWTAQEHVYAGGGADPATAMEREALFGLWQTGPMRDVIAYALASRRTPNPIYVTSFDIQPGSARADAGSAAKSMRAFLAALHPYAPIAPRRAEHLAARLGAALSCGPAPDAQISVAAADALVAQAAPRMAPSRPAFHVAALKLVPAMIRARLDLCRLGGRAGESPALYQRTRDALNAQLALAELNAFPGAKMILWAHHSHLHYNSLGRAIPSMGQRLRQALGRSLYTIGLFAAGGRALDIATLDRRHGLGQVLAMTSSPLRDLGPASAEQRLAALSPRDFFIDLRGAPAALAGPGVSRLEVNGAMATDLTADFDGAVLIHRVSAAQLDFLPGWLRFALRALDQVERHALILLVGLAAAILALVTWRKRRSKAGAISSP